MSTLIDPLTTYTVKEAAPLLDMQPAGVAQAISRGKLKAVKRGNQNFITQEEVERYKRERQPRGFPKSQQVGRRKKINKY